MIKPSVKQSMTFRDNMILTDYSILLIDVNYNNILPRTKAIAATVYKDALGDFVVVHGKDFSVLTDTENAELLVDKENNLKLKASWFNMHLMAAVSPTASSV